MAKNCDYLDYTIKFYLENFDCASRQEDNCLVICNPRNARLIAIGDNDDSENGVCGNPQRIVITSPHLVHVLCDYPSLPGGCIALTIERNLACTNGCSEAWTAINVCYRGSGMMLPPGEYLISIQDQVAHCITSEDIGEETQVTLLFEPASQAFIDAALFNNLCLG